MQSKTEEIQQKSINELDLFSDTTGLCPKCGSEIWKEGKIFGNNGDQTEDLLVVARCRNLDCDQWTVKVDISKLAESALDKVTDIANHMLENFENKDKYFWQSQIEIGDNEVKSEDLNLVNCPVCSSDMTFVQEKYDYVTFKRELHRCTCGKAENGIAAQRDWSWNYSFYQRGRFCQDREPNWFSSDSEMISDGASEWIIKCEDCLQQTDSETQDIDGVDRIINENSHLIEVYCHDCGHKKYFLPSKCCLDQTLGFD